MAIVISGVNNIDKITATDGTIDLLSGVSFASTVTAPAIQSTNLTVAGVSTFIGNVKLPDSTNNQTGRLMLGTGSDLQIFHTGSAGEIGNFTGNLNIKTNSFRVFNGGATQLYIKADQNDSVILHYSNNEKFRTTNTGAVVTGILTATSFFGSFSGSGANLTNLPASQLTGTLPAIDGSNLTGVAGGKFTGTAAGILTTSTVGIQTANVTAPDLVGAASSMVGMYIGDGHLLFSNYLNKSGGYYISTDLNALNAGPVTLGSTMTLDGTWVIV